MPQNLVTSVEPDALPESGRKECEDKAIRIDVTRARWSNILFIRLIAKRRKFTNVDFKYSIFDGCYFRDSVFDSCDFTGCRFISSNLHGAKFTGCKFEYALFERTIVDDSILEEGCPGQENLRMRFARSLRMNYQQIGDAKAANKAVVVELEATGNHLLKAWNSKESYYRKKYSGLNRIKMFLEYINFKCLDYIWGNGESVLKLCRFVGVMLLLIIALDWTSPSGPTSPTSIWNATQRAPQIFFGVFTPKEMSLNWLAAIFFGRLITFGFFMSIIIKRFNRR
jgi:hypothetical protein